MKCKHTLTENEMSKTLDFMIERPAEFGRMLGFTKLNNLHNKWINEMIVGENDITLQASRGTYKTTCVSLALGLLCILYPNKKLLFMRKTDNDVKEVIKQVQKILQDEKTQALVNMIYNCNLMLDVKSATEINTSLSKDIKGTSQLVGIGTGGSLTGKHFDIIFTDDIVNVQDRISKAERERTKLVYQELQNIKNRGGRIINTGTPWHNEDAFSIMPEPMKYDCYHPEVEKIISKEELAEIKEKMVPSLFAANYELRFIPSEKIIFVNPQTNADNSTVEQGIMHIDSAFYGEDYTAWTIINEHGGKIYCYGQIRRKSVEDCYDEILRDYERFSVSKIYTEDNADKGLVAKELRKQGAKVVTYHENTNKYIKIITQIKAVWSDLYFVEDTGKEYIQQVCDYYEDAEHDDAPDSLASALRVRKKAKDYTPIYM